MIHDYRIMMKRDSISRSQVGGTGDILNNDLEFWMTRFPAPLKDIPIIHLAIPGTFESFRSMSSCNLEKSINVQ